jgi:hypothetical protein
MRRMMLGMSQEKVGDSREVPTWSHAPVWFSTPRTAGNGPQPLRHRSLHRRAFLLAPASNPGNQQSGPSDCCSSAHRCCMRTSLRRRETQFSRAETKTPKRLLQFNGQIAETKCVPNRRQFGAIRTEQGNLRLRRTAWLAERTRTSNQTIIGR